MNLLHLPTARGDVFVNASKIFTLIVNPDDESENCCRVEVISMSGNRHISTVTLPPDELVDRIKHYGDSLTSPTATVTDPAVEEILSRVRSQGES